MRCPIIVGSHLQGLARRMVVSIEVIHLVRLLRGTDLYQAIQNLEPVRLTTTPTSIRSDAAAISTTGRQGSVVTATSGSSGRKEDAAHIHGEPIRGHSGFPLKYNVPFYLTLRG